MSDSHPPPPPPAPLPRGTVLCGHLRLDAVLGRGAAAVVYNGWSLKDQRPCALKVLHPELSALRIALLRMQRDNREAARLAHPNLTSAELLEDPSGVVVLRRDLWYGETLRARLARGPLPLGEVARLMVTLCGALDAAHGIGLLHGDLKPENLLFGEPAGILDGAPGASSDIQAPPAQETLRLLDFGMHNLRAHDTGIGAHPLLGPLHYLAPEQLQQEAVVDPRADIFTLGGLLYECLTGQAAFADPQLTPAAVVAKVSLLPPPLPRKLRAELPEEVDVVMEMACHKNPAERFATAGALWLALRTALHGIPEVAQALAQPLPSTASSVAALLHYPPQEAPPRSSRPPRNAPSRPRTSKGARAVELYKQLEQAGAQQGRDDPSLIIRRNTAEEAALRLGSAPPKAPAPPPASLASPAPPAAPPAAPALMMTTAAPLPHQPAPQPREAQSALGADAAAPEPRATLPQLPQLPQLDDAHALRRLVPPLVILLLALAGILWLLRNRPPQS